jgi:hypothetical protein
VHAAQQVEVLVGPLEEIDVLGGQAVEHRGAEVIADQAAVEPRQRLEVLDEARAAGAALPARACSVPPGVIAGRRDQPPLFVAPL